VRDAAVAFAAGLISFATPCVLPLVPAYLSSIGARATGPRASLRAAAPFVAGFSLVFIALGVAAGLAGSALSDHRAQLIQLSGIVIVAMGLIMLGLLPAGSLALGRAGGAGIARAHQRGSSLLLGAAFGLCFTPCVTPVLGSLLVLSATAGETLRSGALLAAYAAGLAVPFLLASVALGQTMTAFRVVGDRYDVIRAVSGVVLVSAGLLVFFDRLYLLNAWVERLMEAA
jgi:cytochrome c-type biogenesis protein